MCCSTASARILRGKGCRCFGLTAATKNPSPFTAHIKPRTHTNARKAHSPGVLLFFAKGQIQITEPLQEKEIRGALGKRGKVLHFTDSNIHMVYIYALGI